MKLIVPGIAFVLSRTKDNERAMVSMLKSRTARACAASSTDARVRAECESVGDAKGGRMKRRCRRALANASGVEGRR